MSNFFNYDGWELNFFDDAKNYRDYQIDIIKKELKGTVAEIGPGNGSLCEKYNTYCDNVVLFEPSKNLFKNLETKFQSDEKIKINNSEFSSSNKKFDCFLLMDVIEHIENPQTLIKSLYDSLNENGKILINVPAFQHLYSKFDEDVGHFKRYTKSSFVKELLLIKPKKVKMFYYDSLGYFLSLVSQLLFLVSKKYKKNYKKDFKSKIKLWNYLIPISKILDRCVINSLGKSLFIIINK
ncbi:class I SAM-dependent methyltransferase [Candidatus Pelagibacter sp.]|nr:class I SAM-dependent methyltransferase [Candidatus Pelagibacter sp.]